MKRTMPLASWLGIGLFAAIILGMLWRHGREWEFSRHGIPVSALSPDGQTYRDGNEIDPLTRAIIRSGDEEVISASLYGFLFLVLTFLAFELWSFSRDRKRWALIGALHETAAQLRQRGDFQEAALMLDRGQRLLDIELGRLKRKGWWKGAPTSLTSPSETKSSHC